MFKFFRTTRAKQTEPTARMREQVYFCDMRGQTHALFATLKTAETREPAIYRIAKLSDRRDNPFVSVVGMSERFAMKDLSFTDETGAPVDMRQRNTQNGLYFFHVAETVM